VLGELKFSLRMITLVSQEAKHLEKPKQTSEVRSVESKVIKALLKEKDVVVSAPEDVEQLASKGYGTKEDKKLTLTLYEALFLVSKGIIEVEVGSKKARKKIGFQQLLSQYQTFDENAWAKYLIYRDLRSRGYVAREGFGLGIDFRVYERGEYGTAAATYLVFGMQEGQPLSLEELTRTLKHAHSLKKELVLAVLNRRGEVVYYSLSKLSLK
jgi:tRNA-intron endonuclease